MKTSLLVLSTILLGILCVNFIHAQDSQAATPARNFDNISLGMSYDAVLAALSENTNFIYRGRPDVSLLDPLDRTIIEVRGSGFVYRGFFSFYQDTLYAMTIVLNQGRLDYFTLWQTLSSRYGEPTDLNPMRSIWEDANTRLSLEQPAILKYIDMPTFNALIERSNTDQSALTKSRDRFLEGL